MIPTSTAPAAKAYLAAGLSGLLTADPTATFGVFYDNAPAVNAPQDVVWISDILNRTLTPLAMVGDEGQWAFKEDYDLTVRINCYRGGDQAQVVTERAWALLAGVETFVRSHPTFGADDDVPPAGLVSWARPMEGITSTTDWNEEATGRFCDITYYIHCYVEL